MIERESEKERKRERERERKRERHRERVRKKENKKERTGILCRLLIFAPCYLSPPEKKIQKNLKLKLLLSNEIESNENSFPLSVSFSLLPRIQFQNALIIYFSDNCWLLF